MEAIASRLEAVATSNKKLLVEFFVTLREFFGNRFTCSNKKLPSSMSNNEALALESLGVLETAAVGASRSNKRRKRHKEGKCLFRLIFPHHFRPS